MGHVNDWKMGGLKSPLNRAQSTLKLGYFPRLRGRPKKAEPQACKIQRRMRDGSTACTAGLGNLCHAHEQFQNTEHGQWEEQVWCAAGWHCCLGRVPLLHPLGLMGTLFLKSLCCCHFSCLTSQKYMVGVQLLLSAASGTALRAVQERAGIIPSCAAASSRAGQRRTGRSILCRDLWSCGHQKLG